jgi:hypothetical protein
MFQLRGEGKLHQIKRTICVFRLAVGPAAATPKTYGTSVAWGQNQA